MPEIAGMTSPIKVSGYFALTEAAAWFRLPGRGLLAVSGEDRVRFLNAMLTGDLRKLTAGEGCYAFSLDARGRVVADAGVYVLADEILLDTEPEGTAALRDHLEHHLIADDAEWRALEDEYCAIAVEGPQSEERLRAVCGELPAQPYGITTLPSGWVARNAATGLPGFRVWTPISSLADWVERLGAAGIPPAAPEEARCVRIENGKPRFGEEITIRFLGPEINLPGVIATGKGCYLGQEVVERVRSRNLLTRALAPVTMPEHTRIAAGAKLLAGDKRVGEVLSVACSPRNGVLRGIAIIALPSASPGTTLQCGQGSGCEVTIAAAPCLEGNATEQPQAGK
ncbi:MAG: hypothetical protein IT169_01545 [Bryobacterales bacterium]|nr:hypothetical protein [Bryobacterales bacterium]